MDTKTNTTLVPGVDYDVLTPEELAAYYAQPEYPDVLAEIKADILARGETLPTGVGEPVSEAELQGYLRDIADDPYAE